MPQMMPQYWPSALLAFMVIALMGLVLNHRAMTLTPESAPNGTAELLWPW